MAGYESIDGHVASERRKHWPEANAVLKNPVTDLIRKEIDSEISGWMSKVLNSLANLAKCLLQYCRSDCRGSMGAKCSS
jgi:hypothetical protein